MRNKLITKICLTMLMAFSFAFLHAQQTICFGDVKTYNVDTQDGTTGTPGSTYAWSVTTSGFTGSITNDTAVSSTGNQVIIDWDTTPAGTYTLQVVETTNGCPGAPVTTTVTVLAALLTPTVAATPTSVCLNGSATFEVSGGTPGSIFSYSLDGGTTVLTETLDSNGAASINVDTSTAGDVTLTMVSVKYNSTPTCETTLSGTSTVTVNALPTVPTIMASAAEVCISDTASFTLTGASGDVINYTLNGTPGTATIPTNSTTVDVQVVTSTAGDQTIVLTDVTNSNGCSINATATDTATITVNALPAVPTITESATAVCQNETASFTLTGSAGDTINYTLNGVSGNANIPVGSTTVDVPVDTSAAGDQTIVLTDVTNSNGCSTNASATDTATITVNALPTVPTIASNNGPVCAGDDASFIINGGAAEEVSYKINGGAVQTLTLNGSGTFTLDIPTTTAGTVSIELIQAENTTTGCVVASTATDSVTVNALPDIPTITVSAAEVCQDGTASFTFTGSEGDVINYTLNGVTGSATIPMGSTMVSVPVDTSASGDQTIVITSVTNGNGCTATADANVDNDTITVNATPTTSTINFVD